MDTMKKIVREIIGDILEMDSTVIQELDSNANLTYYGLDSIKAIEIVISLEERLGVLIEEDDLNIDNFKTINVIIDLLEKLMG